MNRTIENTMNTQITKRTTPANITDLAPGEIFVFGSNLDGIHGAGAARLARQKFGAEMYTAEGLKGRTYALPTVGHLLALMETEGVLAGVARFLTCAVANPQLTFLVTEVGCGLAGHTPEEIAPAFANAPDNVILPQVFLDVLENLKLISTSNQYADPEQAIDATGVSSVSG